MQDMNGMDLNGSAMEVEPAHGAPISAEKPSARSCSIFIKGFGPEACPRLPQCHHAIAIHLSCCHLMQRSLSAHKPSDKGLADALYLHMPLACGRAN